MKRALALLGTVLGLLAVLHAFRAFTDARGAALSAAPTYDRGELERLVGVFEARVDAGAGPSDHAFLGDLYLRRSQTSYDLADLENARMNLELAVAAYPDVPTLTNLAQAHLGLHDFATAARLAADVMAVDPTSFGAVAIAADAQLALGRFEAAAQSIEQLARHLPGDPAVAVRRAQLSFLTGDAVAASDYALEAVAVARHAGPGDAEQAFYRMVAGRFLFEHGEYDRAHDQLAVAYELDPRRPGVLYELGRVAAAEGDLEGAVRYLEQAAMLVPDPTTLALLGDVHAARGDIEAAALQYDTITAIAALEHAAYRRSIAAAWTSQGLEVNQALELAESEAATRPDPTTLDVYALALYRAGRFDEALYIVANALGPADARIWYHAGVIAAAAGQKRDAATYLRTALTLNPRFHPLEAGQAESLLASLDR